MQRHSIDAVFRGLHESLLVVDGLAVVTHGYVRFTADLDLVADLEPQNLASFITALESLGYGPQAPVPFSAFADPENRRRWAAEKGLTVISLSSPRHPATEIDLFVESPFDFDDAWGRSTIAEFAEGVPTRVVGLDDLVSMKRKAGRPKDLDDLRQLERLRGAGS
ncbi:MAG: hypothetical protein IV100_11655 [Myxococcales bacterium]|nr:hypothetical protein [Myxococcales bacterium]